ncbi:MAG: phage protease [Gemmatimonadaceae bacterium]
MTRPSRERSRLPLNALRILLANGYAPLSAHAASDVVIAGEVRDVNAHATVIPAGDVPEWVHLIPVGTIETRDGRGPYRMTDVASVIETSRSYHAGADIPIDFDHQLEYAEQNGGGAPASGWITQLEARTDGLWGKVEWTKPGAEKIRAREYRFLSPVFAHNKAGEILALIRAGLTNKPNLGLTAINSTTSAKDHAMSDVLKAALQRLAAMLGLPTTADQDAIVAAVNATVESDRKNREALTALRTKARLGETASADEIFTAAQAAVTVDPSRFVPMAQHSAVVDQLRTMQTANVERLVDEASKAGKLLPAQRQWAIDYASANPDGFKAFIDKQPTIVKAGEETRRDVETGSSKLTDADRAVCASLGIKEEDFAKNKPATQEQI